MLEASDRLGHHLRTIVAVAVAIVASIAAQQWESWGLVISSAGGFAAGLIASNGNLQDGLIGAVTAAAFYGIGSQFRTGWAVSANRQLAFVQKVAEHGIVGGLQSTAEGGRFFSGFLSAAVPEGASLGTGNYDGWNSGEKIVAAGVIGGTASELGGGKFGNGALTGAFGEAFNELGHTEDVYKILHGVPQDAVLYTAPDGSTFYGPPNANFSLAYKDAVAIRSMSIVDQKLIIGRLIGQGGLFDYQRSGGYFIPAYTNASNFVVGVVMQGAGYSWWETEAIAGGFAMTMSSQGWTERQTKWWSEGYTAAANGGLPQ